MGQERMGFRSLLAKFKSSDLPLPILASPAVASGPEQVPAWHKAVERLEKDRASDALPALLAPRCESVMHLMLPRLDFAASRRELGDSGGVKAVLGLLDAGME